MIRKFQGSKGVGRWEAGGTEGSVLLSSIGDHFYDNRGAYSDIFLLIKDLPIRVNLVSRKERKSNHIKQVVWPSVLKSSGWGWCQTA